jgi:hypothetical protein
MDTIKREKQLRLVPFGCLLVLLFFRQFLIDEENLIVPIILIIAAIASMLYVIYLEKQGGRFNAKKYYLFLFFICFSFAIFLYNYLMIP